MRSYGVGKVLQRSRSRAGGSDARGLVSGAAAGTAEPAARRHRRDLAAAGALEALDDLVAAALQRTRPMASITIRTGATKPNSPTDCGGSGFLDSGIS